MNRGEYLAEQLERELRQFGTLIVGEPEDGWPEEDVEADPDDELDMNFFSDWYDEFPGGW